MEKVFSCEGLEVVQVEVAGVRALGVSTNMPGTDVSIHEVRCSKGMILCGAFSESFVDGKDLPLALFSMPKLEDMLTRTPKYLNPAALEIGATMEMTGEQLMVLFDK